MLIVFQNKRTAVKSEMISVFDLVYEKIYAGIMFPNGYKTWLIGKYKDRDTAKFVYDELLRYYLDRASVFRAPGIDFRAGEDDND